MKLVLALGLLMVASTAHADIEAAIGRCLARIDGDVADALGAPLKDRILALPRHADDESRCISDVTTHCLMDADQDLCFAQMLDGLTTQMRRVHGALPPVLAEDGQMQATYNTWMRKVRDGKAVSRDSCKLPPSYPADACTALSTATALIEARDWQRNLAVLNAARAAAAN